VRATERLLELAVCRQRIVITQDSDFTDLVYAFGKPAPPSILYHSLRAEQLPSMVAEFSKPSTPAGSMTT
jgi:predicted nuclease of predicted toxin-antitoxin system